LNGTSIDMKPVAKGFTLIELMVVVTVIAIMVAVAVPSFAQFISNYRATTAVNDVLQGITLTRNEALKRGRAVILLPNGGDWRQGWKVFVDFNNNHLYDVPATSPCPTCDQLIFSHGVLPGTIAVAGSDGVTLPFTGVNYVIFDGSGYVHPTGNTTLGGIVITDITGSAKSVRTLCLSGYGRPRIAPVPAGSAAQSPASCISG